MPRKKGKITNNFVGAWNADTVCAEKGRERECQEGQTEGSVWEISNNLAHYVEKVLQE